MDNKVTLEINGPVDPERLIADLRKRAPHLILDGGAPVLPPRPRPPTRTSALGKRRHPEAEELLTPAEVAAIFRVDPKTVTRWADSGQLTSIRTPGNHRRYRKAEVMALYRGEKPAA